MKIVHVSHLYYPSQGGVQLWFKNVSERLVKQYGDEVTVVTTNSLYGPERNVFKKIERAEETINGVKVLRFSFSRWHIKFYSFLFKAFTKLGVRISAELQLKRYGPYSKAMKDYLLEVRADVFCGSASNYYFMNLPLWRKCKFFYFGSIHLSEKSKAKALTSSQKKAINASELYLANTLFEKNKLVKAGINASRIMVLGVGVDEEEFKVDVAECKQYKTNLKIPDEAVIVAYVGRIEKTKNLEVLIESFAQLAEKNQNVYLLIAGSGEEYALQLQQQYKSLSSDIVQRIKWNINFSSDEKAILFNTIDILVLPSNNESFGIVFLEAWICKKPVIGAAIGAVKDVIKDGEDGLLMQVNDVGSLKFQLEKLVNEKDLRNQFGESGYKKVKENYTWDIIVSRLREVYLKGSSQIIN